jgi:hypothetical protein
MDPETIIEQLRARPFQPFRIFLTDGSSFEVRHPEMMLVTRRRVIIALEPNRKGLADDAVTCAPIHVTRMEPIPA